MRLLDAMLVAGVAIDNISQWCEINGVSRRTFYRRRDRLRAEGEEGLVARSRRPHHSPAAIPEPVREQVIAVRRSLPATDNGADFVRRELELIAAEEGWAATGWWVPSRATINRVLAAEGLVESNPAKRPKRSWRRFTFAQPRDCYQIDGTCHQLADGTEVVALDVIDDCSRVWVASLAAAAETTDAAIAALQAAVEEFGPPALVLADNGKAFTGTGVLPLSRPARFPATVTGLGARLIHSSCYHPQTLGKCERLHQTVKKLLAATWPQPATSIAELQTRLDQVRDYYNHRRYHSAIRGIPTHAWASAPALGGPQHLPVQTDAQVWHRHTDDRGRFGLGKHRRLNLTAAHKNRDITVVTVNGHLTVYDLNGQVIAHDLLDPTTGYQRLLPLAG